MLLMKEAHPMIPAGGITHEKAVNFAAYKA